MSGNIPTPPSLIGSEAQQLVQLRSYLYRISEMLNVAMNEQTTAIQAVAQGRTGSGRDDTTAQYNDLKSIVIKTSDDVSAEINRIEERISQQYIAKSEWGVYEENINQTIETTAKGVVNSYGYDATLESLQEEVSSINSFRIKTDGYVQQGIIGYSDDGTPIIGIAIGQDLKYREVSTDSGTEVEIDMTQNLATYTSDKITFWQGGAEVAYISNSGMTITMVRVGKKIIIGDDWENSSMNGYTVKWIGG